jgi:hypothetical protein
MITSCLRSVVLSLSLVWGVGTPLLAGHPTGEKVARPQIHSISIVLDDGRRYDLQDQELQDVKGGAIFWDDWALANLLIPYYFFSRDESCSPEAVIRLWYMPGRSGQLPAFLILTSAGPICPLESEGALPGFGGVGFFRRPKITSLRVEYEDGRVIPLSDFVLTDQKSGVMVWSDFAVTHLFVPFYLSAKNLPTKPGDVLRIWRSPTRKTSSRNFMADQEELPGFLVKPRCIPSYVETDD